MGFFTKVYNWLPTDNAAVAASQDVSGNTQVLLNGSLAKNGVVDFPGISRSLTLSTGASYNVTAIINGLRNNQIVQETIIIIPQQTVFTSNFFDSVTSITVMQFALGITVGTYIVGMTRPFIPNSFITSSPVATSIHTRIISGSCSYNIIGSIEPWNNTVISNNALAAPAILYLNNGAKNSVSGDYAGNPVAATTSSFITVVDLPLSMVAVLINAGSTCNLKITIATPKLTT